MKLKDLSGQRFNRLLVMERVPNRGIRVQWSCLCDCGNTTVVAALNLSNGHTKSCGCVRAEAGHITGKANAAHGESSNPSTEYKSWGAMKHRCENPNATYYKYWGGKGVTVCERWRNSFENFLSDMGRKPSPSHSLDRYPDNNGNYEPGNCRWATPLQQIHNRRKKSHAKH